MQAREVARQESFPGHRIRDTSRGIQRCTEAGERGGESGDGHQHRPVADIGLRNGQYRRDLTGVHIARDGVHRDRDGESVRGKSPVRSRDHRDENRRERDEPARCMSLLSHRSDAVDSGDRKEREYRGEAQSGESSRRGAGVERGGAEVTQVPALDDDHDSHRRDERRLEDHEDPDHGGGQLDVVVAEVADDEDGGDAPGDAGPRGRGHVEVGEQRVEERPEGHRIQGRDDDVGRYHDPAEPEPDPRVGRLPQPGVAAAG